MSISSQLVFLRHPQLSPKALHAFLCKNEVQYPTWRTVVSEKCVQKDRQPFFRMELQAELGELLPVQEACPRGVTAAVDVPKLRNVVVLFLFVHAIAGHV